MSYLINLKCSNDQCPLFVSLSKVSHVWITDPVNPVRGQPRIYKAGLIRNDEACIVCKKISSIVTDQRLPKQTPSCPSCESHDTFVTKDRECHLCHNGKIIEASTTHFHLGGHSDEDEERYQREEKIKIEREVLRQQQKEKSRIYRIIKWFKGI